MSEQRLFKKVILVLEFSIQKTKLTHKAILWLHFRTCIKMILIRLCLNVLKESLDLNLFMVFRKTCVSLWKPSFVPSKKVLYCEPKITNHQYNLFNLEFSTCCNISLLKDKNQRYMRYETTPIPGSVWILVPWKTCMTQKSHWWDFTKDSNKRRIPPLMHSYAKSCIKWKLRYWKPRNEGTRYIWYQQMLVFLANSLMKLSNDLLYAGLIYEQ